MTYANEVNVVNEDYPVPFNIYRQGLGWYGFAFLKSSPFSLQGLMLTGKFYKIVLALKFLTKCLISYYKMFD